MSRSEDHPYSDEKTVRRRDGALLRALSTPHKRQAELKVGKALLWTAGIIAIGNRRGVRKGC
jgi:hypothetical protein